MENAKIYNLDSNVAIIELANILQQPTLDNLTEVIKNVNILNNDNEITEILNDTLNLSGLIEKNPTSQLEYVLNHLLKINNKTQLLWNYKVKLLSANYDKNEIERFVINEINSNLYKLPQYKINSMIRLAIVSNNFDLLKKIKTKIYEDSKKE